MPSRLSIAILASLPLAVGCSRAPAPTAAENEKKFQEMMSGATLVGGSTSDRKEGLSGPERYVIEKVSKLHGDTWLIQARLRFGSHDLSAPVPVTIEWAGDTPVIMLTDLKIPGLGSYTARVLFYRDRYAGTWSGSDHGGTLFGKIERGR